MALTVSGEGAYNPATERGGAGAFGPGGCLCLGSFTTAKSASVADRCRLLICRRV